MAWGAGGSYTQAAGLLGRGETAVAEGVQLTKVPDQEGVRTGSVTIRLADLCMCAQRGSLAGWLAVKE